MLAVGDKENLERLYNELLNKDWFMTFPDFAAYCRTKEKAFSDYEGPGLLGEENAGKYQPVRVLLLRPDH